MPGVARPVVRVVAYAGYYGFARHVPWLPPPLRAWARALRFAAVSRLLDSCGTDVNIEPGAWFGSGRGINVGDRSAIGLDALVLGPMTLGSDVMMGPRCTILSGAHDIRRTDVPMSTQGFLPERPVIVEDDVWIGANVTILPGRRLGRGSVVGAGSVVTADIPPYAIAVGNPARVIKYRK